jgi:alginate O-acetyltransferase complex protein AlgI
MSWKPWLILLILFSTSIDYLAALGIDRSRSPRTRKALLLTSIAVNLSLLGYYKYTNFFLQTLTACGGLLGWPMSQRTLEIILPLGISFYTFEAISYVVDVYRGKIRPVRSLLDYGLYILFFPHLIAGPIVRSHDFLPQLQRPKRFSWNRLMLGLWLILIGVFKKAIIADHLAKLVDPVFAHPAYYDSLSVWLALLSYTIQIYCDFAGYSDMAVGLAHTLGFKLPRNFNLPYLACSIADYWRRWHTTLGAWFRDYLYIPLGGSRHGTLNTCRNLMVTFALCGLWHGPSWNYIAWGVMHGVLLSLERLIKLPAWLAARVLYPLWVLWTFFLINMTLVFVRTQSLADAGAVFYRLFQPVAGVDLGPWLLTLGAVGVGGTMLAMVVREVLAGRRLARHLPAALLGAAMGGLVLATLLLWPEDTKAFIYFQF